MISPCNKQHLSSSSSCYNGAAAFAKEQHEVGAVAAPSACRAHAAPPCPPPSAAVERADDEAPVLVSRPNSALKSCFSSPSCASHFFSCPSLTFQCVFIAVLLFCCSVSTSSGRVMGHHHHHSHQQQIQQLLLDEDNEAAVPLSEMISMLSGELLLAPSSLRKLETDEAENVCAKSSDREATIVQSLSKTTGQPVLLLPQQRFKVAYCEQQTTGSASAEKEQCAVGSNCATVYRWTKALVQPPKPKSIGTSEFEFADDVLVPMDCLCVLSWAQLFRGKGPIVFG
ncbi:hypothetical protein niasHT_031668 [Heterodera trifolii]|uniref:Uncharacterized protein n=1 Tax=Heterodera trifolii TaxID=157864 RepID=A0ABD2J6V5_9BILA